MQYNQEFVDNAERMRKLQKYLEEVNYQMLGESSETKTLYEDIRYNVIQELKRLDAEQRRIAKENKDV